MTNEELLAAWKRKLPSVEPTDREMSAFALGVEVGQADAEKYGDREWEYSPYSHERPKGEA